MFAFETVYTDGAKIFCGTHSGDWQLSSLIGRAFAVYSQPFLLAYIYVRHEGQAFYDDYSLVCQEGVISMNTNRQLHKKRKMQLNMCDFPNAIVLELEWIMENVPNKKRKR